MLYGQKKGVSLFKQLVLLLIILWLWQYSYICCVIPRDLSGPGLFPFPQLYRQDRGQRELLVLLLLCRSSSELWEIKASWFWLCISPMSLKYWGGSEGGNLYLNINMYLKTWVHRERNYFPDSQNTLTVGIKAWYSKSYNTVYLRRYPFIVYFTLFSALNPSSSILKKEICIDRKLLTMLTVWSGCWPHCVSLTMFYGLHQRQYKLKTMPSEQWRSTWKLMLFSR